MKVKMRADNQLLFDGDWENRHKQVNATKQTHRGLGQHKDTK